MSDNRINAPSEQNFTSNENLGNAADEVARLHSAYGQAERYLTVGEVARRFSVSAQTIWRWSKEVQPSSFPKPVHIGIGTTRWRLSDLVRFERNTFGGM